MLQGADRTVVQQGLELHASRLVPELIVQKDEGACVPRTISHSGRLARIATERLVAEHGSAVIQSERRMGMMQERRRMDGYQIRLVDYSALNRCGVARRDKDHVASKLPIGRCSDPAAKPLPTTTTLTLCSTWLR